MLKLLCFVIRNFPSTEITNIFLNTSPTCEEFKVLFHFVTLIAKFCIELELKYIRTAIEGTLSIENFIMFDVQSLSLIQSILTSIKGTQQSASANFRSITRYSSHEYMALIRLTYLSNNLTKLPNCQNFINKNDPFEVAKILMENIPGPYQLSYESQLQFAPHDCVEKIASFALDDLDHLVCVRASLLFSSIDRKINSKVTIDNITKHISNDLQTVLTGSLIDTARFRYTNLK